MSTALFSFTVATSAVAVSCLSLDGFTGGQLDGGSEAGVVVAPSAPGQALATWCHAADGGLGHMACFDFDDATNAFAGWTNVVGAVVPDRSVAASPLRSAFASLAGDAGAVRFDGGAEERLVRRFDQPLGSLRVAFDVRADALPANRGYAFATIAFFGSAGARQADRSLSLVLSSATAALTERIREDGTVVEHALERGLAVDGSFHRVEIAVRFPSDGGVGTADATIDGKPALEGEPLAFLTAGASVATIMGIYTVQSAEPAEVAAHYDDVTVDITP